MQDATGNIVGTIRRWSCRRLAGKGKRGTLRDQSMNAFTYRSGQLCCEQVPLTTLAKKFGTPLYVYSESHIVGQWRALDRALDGLEHLVCYAVKANSNLAVLRALAGTDAWHFENGYVGVQPASEVLFYGRERGYCGHAVVAARGA